MADAVDALRKLALSLADVVEVGKGGWTTCRMPLAKAPSATLKRWVHESHALSAKPPPKAKPKKTAAKKTAAKKTR